MNENNNIDAARLDMMEARFKEAQQLGIQPKIPASVGLKLIELARRADCVCHLHPCVNCPVHGFD